MTTISVAVQTEIDDLVNRVEKLAQQANTAQRMLGADGVQELTIIANRGGQLIRRLYDAGSQYHESWQKVVTAKGFTIMHSNHCQHVSELSGILRAVEHDIKSGLLRSLRGLLQAEVFADFLGMTEHLLREKYKDAAAVLLGAVLEDSLRKVAAIHGVSILASNGKYLTIDPLNVGLAKAGVYGPLIQKQITTWANLRNDAAHGQFKNYDEEEVRQMLLFVQKFCADHLG